ncbi:MAG: iron-containing alcohol dehydrogenase, partial [Gammaproteobacteria bacterium]|nr:iron-containing alcohol dehydrogenase [Gammaproteobacteria bacterium]
MSSSFVFNSVSRTTFGSGSSSELPSVSQRAGMSKPLLITDQGIINCGLLEPVIKGFAAQGTDLMVFPDVLADPPEQNIHAALECGRAAGCDGVIGFGGGSSMDV